MYFIFTILIFVLLVAYLKRLIYLSRWNYIKGEKSWTSAPYIGHDYKLNKSTIKTLFEMQKKHGDIFRCDIRGFPTVILCKLEDVQEAFKKEAFSARPYHKTVIAPAVRRGFDENGSLSGVTVGSGKAWKEHRQFMLTNLTNLGMGKKDTMEEIIYQEAEEFCTNLSERIEKKNVVPIKGIYAAATNNVIWRILTGQRYKQTDPVITALTKALKRIMAGAGAGNIVTSAIANSKVLMKILDFVGVFSVAKLIGPVGEFIDRAIKDAEPDGQGTMAERYLAEIEKNEKLGRSDTTFYGAKGRHQIFGGFLDYLLAGTDTSSTFLEWASLYMAAYPHIQDKVFEEICEAVGYDQLPKLSDRSSLPYCQAVIEEIMRISPEGYLNVPHYTTEDTSVAGLFIPKDTQVLAFYGSIQRNPDQFPNPDVFDPERFIENGQFKPHPHIPVFGVGKRRCVGEALGKEEVFLFFVSLFQKFQFSLPGGFDEEDFEGVQGLTFTPKPFSCIVERRDEPQ